MKIAIDTEKRTISCGEGPTARTIPLFSREGFEIVSDLWVKVGWNEKYSYTFTWLGRPIIQLPEDMVRTQEVLFRLSPDVIIETGVAHGGSLIYYASLCRLMGKGRVIGVDIEIKKKNRAAIESHPLAGSITLIEGNSVDPATVAQVGSLIKPGERVLVLLDSCHTRAHVAAELEAYHGFVTPGSYIVATDGIMQDLADVPAGQPGWETDNPQTAALDFAADHPDFIPEQPAWLFDESNGLTRGVTYWPGAWLRRRASDE
ncbi:MAG: hydroxylase [Methanomicrobiales archaeon]|nr:hydroxylase [Methanomicrobiales archaeon]